MSYFSFRNNPGHYIVISPHNFSVSTEFLIVSLFLMNMGVLRNTSLVSCKRLRILDFFFFHLLDKGNGFGGKNRDEVPF